MASVYWIRSLVPIERKSSRRMNIGSASAAAGISIMPPIWIVLVVGLAALVELRLGLVDQVRVWSISCACASIGSSMRTWP